MACTHIAFLFVLVLARADEAPEPGCLLQNQFVNDKFESSGEDTKSHSFPTSQSFLQAKELSRSQLSVFEHARRVSTARRHKYQVHADHLRRTWKILLNSSASIGDNLFQAEVTSASFQDLGTGCCGNRDPAKMPFKGTTADVEACKAKCSSIPDCGYIEYGWKGSKADGTTNWCTILPKEADCSELADGPKDCGAGGGDNGVHTWQLLSADEVEDPYQIVAPTTTPLPDQCQSGSLAPTQYVQHGWTTIPGLKGKLVKDVFVTHGGTFNGAYVLGGGKAPEVVRRKKGTTNQWLLGVHDDKYAKMIELTFQVWGDGTTQVYLSAARYKHMAPDQAKAGFSTSDAMLKLWNSAHGQHRAHCAGCAGYGIAGLKVKACERSESGVQAGTAMGELVNNFIDAQSGAEDACHSQLLEARHQLNQLHEIVIDLAREVNSTEEQIMVYDKMLEEKLREMSALTKWKDVELDKCEDARTKAIAMFGKLSSELDEMHSIASPSVAMNVKSGKLEKVSLAQEMSVNQHLAIAVDSLGEENIGEHHLSTARRLTPHHHHHHHHHATHAQHVQHTQHEQFTQHEQHTQHNPGLDKQSADISMVTDLVAETRKASEAYQECIGPDSSHMSLSLVSEGKPKTNEECEAERDTLEKTYVKAYVELSRMKAEYEVMANSTTCFDSVNEQYSSRFPPLQEAADKLSKDINEKVHQLQAIRPRLEGAKSSETKLRSRVNSLTGQCKNVKATVSDLDKVRDAIQSLSECPGLSRVKFSMPKWIGTWATFDQDATSQDDTDQDALMNSACSKIKAGTRAAEVGEIQEQTVEGIPESNTASNSLMGACPDCAGTDDESFSNGHGRVCWVAGAKLTLSERSDNCGTGKKAILCVQDRPDVREIPGEEAKAAR